MIFPQSLRIFKLRSIFMKIFGSFILVGCVHEGIQMLDLASGQCLYGNGSLRIMDTGAGHDCCDGKADVADIKVEFVPFPGRYVALTILLASPGA